MKKLSYPLAMTTDSKKAKKSSKLKRMKPDAFLEKARKLTVGEGDRDIIDKFKSDIEEGKSMGPLKLYADGTEDGRHRATAAKELDLDAVPVIDERTAKALGGALGSNDPNRFMQDILKFSFQILPLIRPGYLKEVPRQGFADGGTPTIGSSQYAPIDASMLVGRSPEPFRGGEEYTDAGGQKIAAPFVTGMSGGYPTYDFSPEQEPSKYSGNLPGDTNPFEPLLQWNWLSKLMGYAHGGEVRHGYATDGEVEGDVQFAPPEVEQAMKVAQEVAQEPRPFGEEAKEPPKEDEHFKGFLDYGIRSLVSPDIAPQRIMKSLIEMPETVKEFGKGLIESAYKGATLPGDVVTGKVDPRSEEGLKRALDLAGLATSGSTFGTRPAGALASGASRPVEEALAGIGHNMPPEPTESTYQRLINPAGFYSHGHEVAMTQLPEGPRTWQEIQALLKKGNVKKEELSWAGLHPEAYEPTQKVTREEIADKFARSFPQVDTTWKTKGSEMEPKWEQYTAPGGENYSESVLTLPYTGRGSEYVHPQIQNKYADELAQLEADIKTAESEIQQARDASSKVAEKYKQDMEEPFKQYLRNKGVNEEHADALFRSSRPIDISYHLMDQENYANLHDLARQAVRTADDKIDDANVKRDAIMSKMWEESEALHPEYTKEHFSHESHLGDIDNPLLHQRWKERVGPAGERILSNEELQSDWAQQGREKGFKNPEATKAHQELKRRKADLSFQELKEFELNRKTFDEKADALIEKYNNDEAALDAKYLPRMTPEEIAEQKRLDAILSREGGRALSDQEKMRYRYLNNKAHSIDRKDLNQEHIITQEYNLMAQPFVEESLAKNKEIDNNLSLSAAEKQKLKDEEEARYVEKIKPLDDWLRNAIQEHRQNLNKHQKELEQLREAHDNAVDPHRNVFEAKSDEIREKYDKLYKALEEEKAKLPKAGDVPLVPHVGSTEQWTELGVKHALQHALEQGHDQIFIMGGQEQARRWQNALRQSVDNIRWEPSREREWPTLSSVMGEPPIPKDSFKTVYAKPKGDSFERQFVVDKNGVVISSDINQAEGQKLSAVVGSDLAKQIMKEESGNVPMENYIMGSEGYTQHYERKMPSIYKDVIKKYLKVDPKIETGQLVEKGGSFKRKTSASNMDFVHEVDSFVENMPEEEINALSQRIYNTDFLNLSPNQRDHLFDLSHELAEISVRQKWEAEDALGLRKGPHGTTIHITPEMKEAYRKIKQEKGAVFPGYKKGGTVQKALDIVRRGDAR